MELIQKQMLESGNAIQGNTSPSQKTEFVPQTNNSSRM